MSTLFVRHPAPVAFTPARARVERTGFVALRTPATLRREPRDAYDPVPDARDMTGVPETGLLRGADGLWVPMGRHLGRRDGVSGDALARFLAGEGPVAAIDDDLRRTPVGAPDHDSRERDPEMARLLRGVELDLDGARRVRIDGRARAAAALAPWIDRNLRVLTGGGVPDRAYRRFVPALGMLHLNGDAYHLWRVPYFRNEDAFAGLIAQPRDVAALRALGIALGLPAEGDAGVEGVAERLGPGDWGDEVRALVVNLHACQVHRTVSVARNHSPADDPRTAELDAMQEQLERLAAFAEIGLGQGEDVGAALRLLADGLALAGATAVHGVRPRVLEGALRRFHLATLAGPEPDAEDVAALGALAPGL